MKWIRVMFHALFDGVLTSLYFLIFFVIFMFSLSLSIGKRSRFFLFFSFLFFFFWGGGGGGGEWGKEGGRSPPVSTSLMLILLHSVSEAQTLFKVIWISIKTTWVTDPLQSLS